MSVNEEQQAELLEDYCHELEANPAALPPAELDPELAAEAKLLRGRLDAPLPGAAFRAQLKEQLQEALLENKGDSVMMPADELPETEPVPTSLAPRFRFLPQLATIAVVALIVVAGWFLVGGLQKSGPLSASEILKRAQNALTDDSIKSIVFTGTMSVDMSVPEIKSGMAVPASGPITSSTFPTNNIDSTPRQAVTATAPLIIWYQAPNKWHTLSSVVSYPAEDSGFLNVSDGVSVWDYQYFNGKSYKQDELYIKLYDSEYPPSSGTSALEHLTYEWQYTVLDTLGPCYTPTLKGNDVIAGRNTYVIDSGVSHCQATPAPGAIQFVPSPAFPNGQLAGSASQSRFVVWIDQSNYFMLKYQIYGDSPSPGITVAATSAQFDVPIDPSVFSFTPPADATIYDLRPKGAATTSQFDAQMRDLAGKMGYTLFAPSYLPNGLSARLPTTATLSSGETWLTLEYLPTNQVNQPVDAIGHGLRIVENPLGNLYTHISNEQLIYVGGRTAWLTSTHTLGGLPETELHIYREGDTIDIDSAAYKSDELMKVAAGLMQVPISVSATPTPVPDTLGLNTPPKLDDLRSKLPFSVFVPANPPAGLIIEPPVKIDLLNLAQVSFKNEDNRVDIDYHNPDGSFALSVLSGPSGCCRDADKAQQGESASLVDGTTAHFLNNAPEQGGPTLWLVKSGTYVEVRGWQMSKDALVALANTLSSTANPYGASVSGTPAPLS